MSGVECTPEMYLKDKGLGYISTASRLLLVESSLLWVFCHLHFQVQRLRYIMKEESIKICGKVHETVSFQCYQELSNIVVTKIKTRLTGVIILLW